MNAFHHKSAEDVSNEITSRISVRSFISRIMAVGRIFLALLCILVAYVWIRSYRTNYVLWRTASNSQYMILSDSCRVEFDRHCYPVDVYGIDLSPPKWGFGTLQRPTTADPHTLQVPW